MLEINRSLQPVGPGGRDVEVPAGMMIVNERDDDGTHHFMLLTVDAEKELVRVSIRPEGRAGDRLNTEVPYRDFFLHIQQLVGNFTGEDVDYLQQADASRLYDESVNETDVTGVVETGELSLPDETVVE